MCRSQRSWLLSAVVVALMPAFVQASRIDDLIAALAGNDEQARTLARQLLPREGVEAVPKLLPLLRLENPAVRDAAFNVLADLANEASAPGRAADRSAVAAHLMTLFQPDQPARETPGTVADSDRDSCRWRRRPRGGPARRSGAARAGPRIARGDGHSAEQDGPPGAPREGGSRVRLCPARCAGPTPRPGEPRNNRRDDPQRERQGPRRRRPRARVDGRPDTLEDGSVGRRRRRSSHAVGRDGRPLRLIDHMGRQLPHQHAAVVGYLQLLASARGPEKDGALAGLGRVGDASCVPAVLAAIRDAEPPTLLAGMSALSNSPGKDVTRALVEAYPGLPVRAQLSLIPVLGSRRDPLVRPILEQAASSGRKEFRLAALEALKDGADIPSDKTNAQTATDLPELVGVVRRCWVVGPFDLGDRNEGWETAYIDEPRVNVVARYMAGKTRRQWKLVTSHDPMGKIDLRAVLADRDNCIGYAYAEIELDKPTDALLLLGVDDSEKIWVNGKKVLEQFTARPLQVDQDRVPVHLEAGKNSILLKLYQNNQGWEFCARIVTTDGRLVPFEQKSE